MSAISFSVDPTATDATKASVVQSIHVEVWRSVNGNSRLIGDDFFVEAWVIDPKTGKTGWDTHEIKPTLLPRFGDDWFVFTADFKVGVGVVDNLPITGNRGTFKKVPGVGDQWVNQNKLLLPKVTFLGPTKSYRVTLTVFADGSWTYFDGLLHQKQQFSKGQTKLTD